MFHYIYTYYMHVWVFCEVKKNRDLWWKLRVIVNCVQSEEKIAERKCEEKIDTKKNDWLTVVLILVEVPTEAIWVKFNYRLLENKSKKSPPFIISYFFSRFDRQKSAPGLWQEENRWVITLYVVTICCILRNLNFEYSKMTSLEECEARLQLDFFFF